MGLAIRFFPSLTDLIVLFPLLFVIFKMQGVSTLLGDGDTGWHIRAGEWILQHGSVPHADFFSFSKPGQPWFAWEWGWDVCFALLHQAGGLSAVVFVNLLLLGIIFALLFRLVRRQCPNDLVSAIVTLLAIAGTSLHWLARPHLMSWLFLLIFCHILSRASEGRTRLLYALPFLTLLWTNLHAGFFVGIALVFSYAAEPLIRSLRRGHPNGTAEALPFALCGLACLFASLLNPYGLGLHQHVLSYLLDSKQLENISEFQSINFHHPLARYFELMLAVGTISAFQAMRRGSVREAMVVLAWAHLALLSIRNIPVFLLFAAPMVARTAAGWLSRFPRWYALGREFHGLERIPRFHVLPLAIFTLLFLSMSQPGDFKLLHSEYDPEKYPAKAVEQLQADRSSKVFTDDEWGDYLIYRMYPSGRVFVDGRSDFYGADFEDRYLEIMNVRYDWEQRLAQYDVATVLLHTDAALAGALKRSDHWKVTYDDGLALIFRRTGGSSTPMPAAPKIPPRSLDMGNGL